MINKFTTYQFVLRKNNKIVNGRHTLNVVQTRIVNSAMVKILNNEYTDNTVILKILDLQDSSSGKSIKKWAYQYIREATESLTNTSINIRESSGNWKSMAFVAVAGGHEEFRDEIYLKFSKDMIDLIKEVMDGNAYTMIPWEFIKFKLNSVYSFKLYELLAQYRKLPTKIKHRQFTLDELKELFGLSDGAYARPTDFYNKIVIVASKEITKETDIEITEIKEIRKGKKLHSVKFIYVCNDIRYEKTKEENPKQLPATKLIKPAANNYDRKMAEEEEERKIYEMYKLEINKIYSKYSKHIPEHREEFVELSKTRHPLLWTLKAISMNEPWKDIANSFYYTYLVELYGTEHEKIMVDKDSGLRFFKSNVLI